MLIVGLGNFGKPYENTYHNVGFITAEMLAEKLGLKLKEKGCKAVYGECYIAGDRVVIAQPQTYMNLSGESVKELQGRFSINNQDTIIIYDDIDLPLGSVRIREDGSGGTHNGMKNIVSELNSKSIPRIRIGIGRPENDRMELKDYVLSKIAGERKEVLDNTFNKVATALESYLRIKDWDALMREINNIK